MEYATNACIREGSNPIVSVGISIPEEEEGDGDGGDTVLVMATISPPPPSSPSTTSTDNRYEGGNENEMDSSLPTPEETNHQRTQFRIIEVPLSASYSSHRHVSTSTILIGLSGLLPDATSLLQIAYSKLEEEQRVFGWHRLGLSPVGMSPSSSEVDEDDEDGGDAAAAASFGGSESRPSPAPPSLSKRSQSIATQSSETALRLSRAIADECQKHAFGGGLRPFGASLLLAGVDARHVVVNTDDDNNNFDDKYSRKREGARVAMCETHPNGGWKSCVSNMEIDDEKTKMDCRKIPVPQIMVSGGATRSQDRLRSSMESRLYQLYRTSSGRRKTEERDGQSPFMRQALRTIVSSLVEEWRSRGEDPLIISSSSTPSFDSTADASENSRHSEKIRRYDQANSMQQLPQMEIVIASSKRGTFRLYENDVAMLMKATS